MIVLICSYPIISDVEYFLCACGHYISFFGGNIYSDSLFSNQIFFLSLSYISSLYILDINPLSYI